MRDDNIDRLAATLNERLRKSQLSPSPEGEKPRLQRGGTIPLELDELGRQQGGSLEDMVSGQRKMSAARTAITYKTSQHYDKLYRELVDEIFVLMLQKGFIDKMYRTREEHIDKLQLIRKFCKH